MSRYLELAQKVDAFFARVQDRHRSDLQCDTGCADCCHVRLTVTGVEARALEDELAGWSEGRRAALVANLAAAPADRCAALDPEGRCLVYAARPLVCRSHGAPIRMTTGRMTTGRMTTGRMTTGRMTTSRSLPVVEACFRNFTAAGPAAADPDCILDQTTLSAMLLAVDREAGGDGSRRELARVLTDALAGSGPLGGGSDPLSG